MRTRQAATLACILLFALALAAAAQYAFHSAGRQQEFPQATDRFGYLQMAQDLRLGSAPHNLPPFTADSPHARLLIDFLRSHHLPVDNNAFVAPPSYHYVESSDRIICQYPPGVARMLSLLPPGRAVFTWQTVTLAALLLAAAIASLRALLGNDRLLPAAFAAAAALTGILMLGATISYSVDLLLLPLALSLIAAFCAARRPGWLHIALALLAGAALGWGVVIRLAAALFVPGFLALLWPRRLRPWPDLLKPLAFLAAFALAGPLPLLLHNRALTGSPFHSTYAPVDTASSVSTLPANLHSYLLGDGSDHAWFTLALLAAFILTQLPQPSRAPARPLIALALWLAIPTAYLLCHPITTPYYQLPTLFVALAALALIAFPLPAPPIKFLSAALGLTLLAIIVAIATLPALGPDDHYAMPDTSIPEPLRDPHAWILGDRLPGTLWYYHGILAHTILNADPDTRLAFYDFVKARGEPLYLMYDDPLLKQLSPELARMKVTLTPVGKFAEADIYRLDWR